MPLYEFKCCKCRKIFESIENVEVTFIVCECGYIANRIMSVTNFKLSGSGWADDGYSSKKPSLIDNAPK